MSISSAPSPRHRAGRVLLFSVACALLAVRASAHTENSEGFSTIRVEANRVVYDLYLDYFELARVVQLGVGRGAPVTELQRALRRTRAELEAHLGTRLQVALDGVTCPGQVAGTEVERRLDREYARITLEFLCPGAHAGGVLVRYDLLFDDSDSAHRNLVTYQADGRPGQFVFTASARALTVGRGTIGGQALRFVDLGFHHILAGYDHILFVVALLLGTTSLAGVFPVLSLFTLAHSVTLVAAVLDVVRFPAQIVEPLIALSIACVAVESLLGTTTRVRWPVVFGFGLVHGMGFAGALQIIGAQGWNLALPLLSFNVGIELGQGVMVLLVFPLLVVVRRFTWSRLVQGAAQVAISIFGLLWYFERLTS